MTGVADGISATVGSTSLGPGRAAVTGPSQPAGRLRSGATGFLGEMRR